MGFIINPYIYASADSYLVDDYSPTVAFSVRKISSTATNCLRVRRSSDNAEQDIGFSGNDLDTASISSFVGANSGYVVKWYNQGTGGATYDASQATGGNQPRLVNAGTIETDPNNGLTAFYFDGSSSYLTLGSSWTYTSTMSFLSVFNRASSGILSVIYGRVASGNSTVVWWRASNNENFRISTTASVVIDSANTATGDFLHEIYYSSNTVDLYKNGSSIGTTGYTLGTADSFNDIGRNYLNYHNGYMQEAIIIGTDEVANRSTIETDINGYYSIY